MDSEVYAQTTDFVTKQVTLVDKLLVQAINELSEQVNSPYLDESESYYKYRMSEIEKTLAYIRRLFASGMVTVIPRAYEQGYEIVYEALSSRAPEASFLLDNKTINVLIKDAVNDFTTGLDGARDMIAAHYKISKQAVITESQISELVAEGLISKGDAQSVKRKVVKLFSGQSDSAGGSSKFFTSKNIPDDPKSREYFQNFRNKKIAALKREFKEVGLDNKEFLKRLHRLENAIDNKQFIRIINKNGDYMHFTVDYYSEMVTRSRIGDSQVMGTLETMNQEGLNLLRVTDHNTKTEKCRKFEGKYFTIDNEMIGKTVRGSKDPIQSATRENLPLYHPNCLHRIVPFVYLDEEIV